jgi:hypothetical protein
MIRIQKRLAIITLNLAAMATIGWAGCKGDCKDTYASEIEDCHLLHDDPDDADDLKQCIEDAKDAYDSCIEECDD